VNEEAVAWRYNRAFGPAGVKAVFGISRTISPEFAELIVTGPDLGPKIVDIYTEFTDPLEGNIQDTDVTLNIATIPWLYENYYFDPYHVPMISQYILVERDDDDGLCAGINEIFEDSDLPT